MFEQKHENGPNEDAKAAKVIGVSCFVIEHNSFIEVKDCFIKSVKDKENFD